MSQLTFTKATKKQARARIAFEGPSGSGKTYTSLVTARALGQRIALIDTEHRSASLYADEFEFDTLPLDSYDPQLLIQALAVAAAAGYDVVVIDSLSHFWMGVDGMLEQVDRAAKRSSGGNTFGGWKDMAPVERRMLEAMLAFPGHVIATLRQKTEWVIEENERGKKVPKKIGLKAIQRDGLEYEFTIVGDLNHDNELIVTKSRCKSLAGAVIRKPDEEFGRTILNWLEDGESSGPTVTELRDQAIDKYATREDLLALYQRAQKLALLGAPVVDDHGDATTLGELIAAKGRAAANRPVSAPPAVDAAAPAAVARVEETGQKRISDQRKTKLHAMFATARITDRDDKLAFINALLPADRQIASTSDLLADDAQMVFEAIQAAIDEQKATV